MRALSKGTGADARASGTRPDVHSCPNVGINVEADAVSTADPGEPAR